MLVNPPIEKWEEYKLVDFQKYLIKRILNITIVLDDRMPKKATRGTDEGKANDTSSLARGHACRW